MGQLTKNTFDMDMKTKELVFDILISLQRFQHQITRISLRNKNLEIPDFFMLFKVETNQIGVESVLSAFFLDEYD